MNQMDPEKVNYNAFKEDDRDYREENNQNLKLSTKKSRFGNPVSSRPTEEEFQRDVQNFKQKELDIRARVADLAAKYKGIILDRVVEDNKSPIQKDLESALVQELVQFGLQLDNDQEQPEGIGSIGLCNLLLSVNILQRNQMNKMSYEIAGLKKKVAHLEKLNMDDEDVSR